VSARSEPLDDIRRFWEDRARLPPPAPAAVLDAGCGTGFLTVGRPLVDRALGVTPRFVGTGGA
jgi:hypothetical protein